MPEPTATDARHPLRALVEALMERRRQGAWFYVEIHPSNFQTGDFSTDNWRMLDRYVGECLRTGWGADDEASVIVVAFSSKPNARADAPVEAIAGFRVTGGAIESFPGDALRARSRKSRSKWAVFVPASPDGWVDGRDLLPEVEHLMPPSPRSPGRVANPALPLLPPARRPRYLGRR